MIDNAKSEQSYVENGITKRVILVEKMIVCMTSFIR